MTLIKQGTKLETRSINRSEAPYGDTQLIGFWWENLSRTDHYFVLHENFERLYPPHQFPTLRTPTEWQRFKIPAGMRGYVPHRYYTVHTHDGKPVVGQERRGEFGLA